MRNSEHLEMSLSRGLVDGVVEEVFTGVVDVFENRAKCRGRKLPLRVVVLPALAGTNRADPMVYLAGGPGEAATELVSWFVDSPLRRLGHDLVLVDSRGTGPGHRLAASMSDGPRDLLASAFDPAEATRVLAELEGTFDLRQYSTAAMIDDLAQVIDCLGFEQVNLMAGSFGTYTAQMFIRAHEARVRSAFLASLVCLEQRVPLHHAQSAQWALNALFTQCANDASAAAQYPNLREQFAAVMAELKRSPVQVPVKDPATGAQVTVMLDERSFADVIRVTMYSGEGGRSVPLLVSRAHSGELTDLAQVAADISHSFYANLPLGLYYAITANEFVRRISPDEIEPATRDCYLGSTRLRDQYASCAGWPETDLPADWFAPFRSNVPTLMVSGDTDPGTPPQWAEVVAQSLPNSHHVVVPDGHVPRNDALDRLAGQLFATRAPQSLDLTEVAALRPAPFAMAPTKTLSDQ